MVYEHAVSQRKNLERSTHIWCRQPPFQTLDQKCLKCLKLLDFHTERWYKVLVRKHLQLGSNVSRRDCSMSTFEAIIAVVATGVKRCNKVDNSTDNVFSTFYINIYTQYERANFITANVLVSMFGKIKMAMRDC